MGLSRGQDYKFVYHICSYSIGHETRSHLDTRELRDVIFTFAQ